MNAPVARAAPADVVDLLFSGGGEEERSLRRRILRARDSSSLRAWQPSRPERARELYLFATQWGSEVGLAPAMVNDLKQVLRGLTGLFIAASVIEEFYRADADE